MTDEYRPVLPGLLTPQEMYKIACTPKDLPENFAQSLRAYVIFLERGHEVYNETTDNYYSPSWGVALRVAIGQGEEWLRLGKTMVEHHYYGASLLHRIAQELCRDTVPFEERVL